MFDLSLVHIVRAEQQRELAEELRARRILRTTDEHAAGGTMSSRRAAAPRGAVGLRSAGR
jgi:hypothetical protein